MITSLIPPGEADISAIDATVAAIPRAPQATPRPPWGQTPEDLAAEAAWQRAEEARDLLRRLTSRPRHEARVLAALAVAKAWAIASGHHTEDGDCAAELVTAVVLAAELGGCYGSGLRDLGAGTSRLPGFDRLGKGRRQASDGPAWTAAVQEAFVAARNAYMQAIPPGGPGGYAEIVGWNGPDEFMAAAVITGRIAPEAIASLGDGAAALRAAKAAYDSSPETALALCRAVADRRAAAIAAAEQPAIPCVPDEALVAWAIGHPEVAVTVEQAHADGAGCREGIAAWLRERGIVAPAPMDILAEHLSDPRVALVVRAAMARAQEPVEEPAV